MHNLLVVFLSSFALVHLQKYSQHEYKIVMEHIEALTYDKTFFDYMYAKNVKPNRTYKAMEIGFRSKRDFSGDKFKMHIEALQFFHNEYRRSPIMFDVKVCDVLELKTFGMGKLLSENGNLTKCPIRAGTYLIHDFNFDSTEFPPHVPRGRWQIQLRTMYDKIFLGGIKWFGSCEDNLKY